ncbi:MAG TPA: M23 family metallopeptidase [Candidatus Blautia pullicola]|uniref:M23 family metallopeptidase n=1 Tax=Candidatus Blautia pullicola TaxID=2838498 RepID=A0A9D2FPK0_9FIRM|nr:M23 family metallopeptidase [Candidatus Blautia pullicola]
MNQRRKIRIALGSVLALALVVTCAAVYQSGSKSTPNEKEFVKENQEDSVDQAIKTEEREDTENANTSNVEGTREIEDEADASTDTDQDQMADSGLTEDGIVEENQDSAAAGENTQDSAEVTEENENTESASAEIQTEIQAAAPTLNFTESSLMEWPVNGQVVLDYNMDNTIYFPTLNVYKTNPAIAISAEVGTPVAAVADGKVVSIAENEETGTTVTLDMGNGYQAVYGQLKDVTLQAEEYISAGGVLGYINEPTKYYTEEGANLYFALSKDGVPLDPQQYLP